MGYLSVDCNFILKEVYYLLHCQSSANYTQEMVSSLNYNLVLLANMQWPYYRRNIHNRKTLQMKQYIHRFFSRQTLYNQLAQVMPVNIAAMLLLAYCMETFLIAPITNRCCRLAIRCSYITCIYSTIG
jgi:hypothetical protein